MSLGELDQDDAGLGPTSRFGLHPEVVRAWLDEMPAVLGMDGLVKPCLIEIEARKEKDPGGVTGFVLIAQSHLSVHTFPRRGFVSADVFTRPDHCDHERIRHSLIATVILGEVESDLIPRHALPARRSRRSEPDRRSDSGMIRAAGQPGKSLACCIPAEGGASARRSHRCSVAPDPAVISCRWKESGTATVRAGLTPARAHVPS